LRYTKLDGSDLAFYFRAKSLVEIGEFDQALVDLERLSNWFREVSKRVHKYKKSAQEAISSRPDDVRYELGDVYSLTGIAYAGLNDHKNAEKYFKKAARKNRKNPFPYFYLAEHYFQKGDTGKAKKYFRKVAKLLEGDDGLIAVTSRGRLATIEREEK